MTHPQVAVTSLDLAHIPAAVRLHCEVFAESPSGRLGPHYVGALFRWFVNYDGAIVLAAEDATGNLVGYAFGAPAAYGATLRNDLRMTVAGALVRRPWALLDRVVLATMAGYLRQLWRRTRRSGVDVVGQASPEAPLPSRVWSLVAIAVSPSHRRSSIGRLLLSEFEQRSRRSGASQLRLTVTLDNSSARRFYDRAGWEPGPCHPDGTQSYSKRMLEPDGQ